MFKALTFCLALVAYNATAQAQPTMPTTVNAAVGNKLSQPFKGANTIVLHTPDSSAVALQKFGRLMVLQGYAIDKYDLGLGYLTTKGKPIGQLTPAVYTYTAVAIAEGKGTAIHIKGEYAVPLGLRSMTESMYWVKGNLLHAKQCFSAVEKVAQSYPAADLSYLLER